MQDLLTYLQNLPCQKQIKIHSPLSAYGKAHKKDNKEIESMPLTEMDEYWDKAKLNLRKTKNLQ